MVHRQQGLVTHWGDLQFRVCLLFDFLNLHASKFLSILSATSLLPLGCSAGIPVGIVRFSSALLLLLFGCFTHRRGRNPLASSRFLDQQARPI